MKLIRVYIKKGMHQKKKFFMNNDFDLLNLIICCRNDIGAAVVGRVGHRVVAAIDVEERKLRSGGE